MTAVPFTDAETGLRAYRFSPAGEPVSPRVPRGWFVIVALAFLFGLVLGTRVHAADEPCVRLQLRPQFLLQRGDVDVQARVGRHADHRQLQVSWDSDAGAGGSRRFDLEGDRSPALFQWWNVSQPPGHYVFEARVFDAGGRQVGAVDRKEIRTAEDPQ